MRALIIGLIIGLTVGFTVMLVALGDTISMTGAAIGTTGKTITLPANAPLSTHDADVRIARGTVEPLVVRLEAGTRRALSVLAVTGPARLTIPELDASTPMLSDRQVHTLSILFDEPGEYEGICRPCGTGRSLESVRFVVT